jgi:hypothetical protein
MTNIPPNDDVQALADEYCFDAFMKTRGLLVTESARRCSPSASRR